MSFKLNNLAFLNGKVGVFIWGIKRFFLRVNHAEALPRADSRLYYAPETKMVSDVDGSL